MTVPSLRCPDCGATYADRWRCECGRPLEYATTPLPDGPAPDPAAFDTRAGLWSFSEFLPESPHVTLGEGMTPLVDAPAWDAQFKLEYVFPTGSFKDRGATVTVSRAAALGVDTLVEDSSGNAGAAIATYAARAGIDADVYVPASVKESKLRAIRRAGATPVTVEGPRQATTEACIEAVRSGEGWYASHAWNPAFFAGTATVAHEIALQRDWDVPDAVVLPLGHGTLFLGAYRGFRALLDAGWTDSLPRLLGVQAAGHAPIVAELRGESEARSASNSRAGDPRDDVAAGGANQVSDGIQIDEPVRRGQILDAIDATDGDAIALGADPVERELDRLHSAGFYVEPTSAVAPAALTEYRERGVLVPADDVVVPLTGSGLKDRP